MDQETLRGVDALVEQILEGVQPLKEFPMPLVESMGMAVAADVVAPVSLPHVDSAAVDGYAVRASDVAGASEESPVSLPVVGDVHVGRANHLALSPGTAVRISVGAPIPAGATCVVPTEVTDGGVARVEITAAAVEGEHVRHAGEDIAVGDVVLDSGTVLGPRHVGLLAALGLSHVPSRPRPRVVVLSTGSELQDPGAHLPHDSVYDANSYLLAASARALGATVYRVGIVSDDTRAFSEAISDQLVRADLVITSGGVSAAASAGGYDVVREALEPLGTVWFGETEADPGGRMGWGHIGEDEVPLLALPGDPVAAHVAFETYVVPAVRRLMGRDTASRMSARARLSHPVTSPEGRRSFLHAAVTFVGGTLVARPLGGAAGAMTGDMAEANALIEIDTETTSLAAGADVSVLLLDEDF